MLFLGLFPCFAFGFHFLPPGIDVVLIWSSALASLRLAEGESGGMSGSDVLWFNFIFGLVWFDISTEDWSTGMVYW